MDQTDNQPQNNEMQDDQPISERPEQNRAPKQDQIDEQLLAHDPEPESNSKGRSVIGIIVVVILLIGLGGFYFWLSSGETSLDSTEDLEEELRGTNDDEIYEDLNAIDEEFE
ncbi:MAG: hypothetical protein WDZ82_01100 [Candidatus Paceibacterota bacterium]